MTFQVWIGVAVIVLIGGVALYFSVFQKWIERSRNLTEFRTVAGESPVVSESLATLLFENYGITGGSLTPQCNIFESCSLDSHDGRMRLYVLLHTIRIDLLTPHPLEDAITFEDLVQLVNDAEEQSQETYPSS
ncbi:MAG: hypothetical protein MI807_14055 [Verrucomicrobiales bacterium]|nr:hypothetical protein [Verrucomicrobiales bacterium]